MSRVRAAWSTVENRPVFALDCDLVAAPPIFDDSQDGEPAPQRRRCKRFFRCEQFYTVLLQTGVVFCKKVALLERMAMPEVNEYEARKEMCFGGPLQRCERFARRFCDRSYNPRWVPAIVLGVVMAKSTVLSGLGRGALRTNSKEMVT